MTPGASWNMRSCGEDPKHIPASQAVRCRNVRNVKLAMQAENDGVGEVGSCSDDQGRLPLGQDNWAETCLKGRSIQVNTQRKFLDHFLRRKCLSDSHWARTAKVGSHSHEQPIQAPQAGVVCLAVSLLGELPVYTPEVLWLWQWLREHSKHQREGTESEVLIPNI